MKEYVEANCEIICIESVDVVTASKTDPPEDTKDDIDW